MLNPDTPCEFAKMRYFTAYRWLLMWNILVFGFGAFLTLFLVAAIVVIRQNWLPAALTVLGTIVSSTAVAWVVRRREVSAKEERAAFKEVKLMCGSPGVGFMAMEQQPWLAELRSNARKSLFW
jgi:hypothetical protein